MGAGRGQRFNASKLLLDPYAKAISGAVDHRGPILPYDSGAGDPRKMDDHDSANFVPKGVVVDDSFDWGNDAPPETPLSESVIYELHVGGFSKRNPEIPEEQLRGRMPRLGATRA